MEYTKEELKAYDCHSKFDINKHKAKYIDYLEVVVLEDGTVEYAVPSHEQKLLNVAIKKLGKSKQEIIDACPEERYFDFVPWLCEITNSLSVWCWFHAGYCNQAQYETMKKLKDYGIYYGNIQLEEK